MSRRSNRRKAARRPRTHSANSSLGRSLYRRPQFGRTLRLEPLEDRRLLALVTVTTLADTVDLGDGVTSLREAIFATNTVPGTDTIEFAPALTANGPAMILLTQGELAITDSLTINGPGADLLTIDASGNDPTPDVKNFDGSRVLRIDDNQISTLIDVAIEGLTLTGGDKAVVGSPLLNNGGAILSHENLSLSRMAVVGNATRVYGGGVCVERGSLRVSESTISDNYAVLRGGGIYSFRSQLIVENSIVEDNISRLTGTDGGGGGIPCARIERLHRWKSDQRKHERGEWGRYRS